MSSLDTIESAPAAPPSPPRIDWPAAPPPAPRAVRSPRRRLALAALLGLVVGALVVGGFWLGADRLRTPDSGPGADAAKACAVLKDLPAFTSESLARSDGAELRTASELSAAAARADQQYSRLADATRQAYLSSTELDVDSVDRQVNTALSECGR